MQRTPTLLAALAFAAIALQAQTPRPTIDGISHLAVYTSDPAKARAFYVHDLGATPAADPEDPAGVRYYFSPVQFVEVLPLPAAQPDARNRLDHAAFRTTNAEKLLHYLGEHHVAVPATVTRHTDASQSFRVKDPEGNTVEFVQPPPHPAAVPLNPLSHRIIHVGYIVHNPELEDTFFHDLLGFRPYWHGGGTEDARNWISSQVPDGRDWMEYMVAKGPEKTGIPAAMTQDLAGTLDHFALGIVNAEQSMNLLYSGDRLRNKHSDAKIGRDGKWQINLFDPDGTRAELMEFQPAVEPCCSPFLGEQPTE